jgi:hypothetical protein
MIHLINMDTPPQIYTQNDTILLNLVIYSRKNKFIFNNILKKLLSRITNITTLLTNLWALGASDSLESRPEWLVSHDLTSFKTF